MPRGNGELASLRDPSATLQGSQADRRWDRSTLRRRSRGFQSLRVTTAATPTKSYAPNSPSPVPPVAAPRPKSISMGDAAAMALTVANPPRDGKGGLSKWYRFFVKKKSQHPNVATAAAAPSASALHGESGDSPCSHVECAAATAAAVAAAASSIEQLAEEANEAAKHDDDAAKRSRRPGGETPPKDVSGSSTPGDDASGATVAIDSAVSSRDDVDALPAAAVPHSSKKAGSTATTTTNERGTLRAQGHRDSQQLASTTPLPQSTAPPPSPEATPGSSTHREHRRSGEARAQEEHHHRAPPAGSVAGFPRASRALESGETVCGVVEADGGAISAANGGGDGCGGGGAFSRSVDSIILGGDLRRQGASESNFNDQQKQETGLLLAVGMRVLCLDVFESRIGGGEIRRWRPAEVSERVLFICVVPATCEVWYGTAVLCQEKN